MLPILKVLSRIPKIQNVEWDDSPISSEERYEDAHSCISRKYELSTITPKKYITHTLSLMIVFIRYKPIPKKMLLLDALPLNDLRLTSNVF